MERTNMNNDFISSDPVVVNQLKHTLMELQQKAQLLVAERARVIGMLEHAIGDYLQWMISRGYSPRTLEDYERALRTFLTFVARRYLPWSHIFTPATIKAFQKEHKNTYMRTPIRGLSRYLWKQLRIPPPVKRHIHQLPEIYQEYLAYYARCRQSEHIQGGDMRRVLCAFHEYLESAHLSLSRIKIEHIDAFLAALTVHLAPGTSRLYRAHLRGFLRYLYLERRVLSRDLAPLVGGPPLRAQAKPPRFLRPLELQRLFASLKLSTPRDIRTYAMIHLAYTLGLRPQEISSITLDDISFDKAELTLKHRKNFNPLTLPLPQHTIKAIAAYLLSVRPKSSERTLFLTLNAPYKPINSAVVSRDITLCMRKAHLPSTAYWLRHTYAQNLLEAGISIYEMKEMLGHDSIESTRKYLHVHTKLMRQVLFDETI